MLNVQPVPHIISKQKSLKAILLPTVHCIDGRPTDRGEYRALHASTTKKKRYTARRAAFAKDICICNPVTFLGVSFMAPVHEITTLYITA